MNEISIDVAMDFCHSQGLYPRLEEHDKQIVTDELTYFAQWLVDSSVCGCADCAYEDKCDYNCADTLLSEYQKYLEVLEEEE